MMKIYTDSIHKIAYSTDASVYREIPYGVAYPESVTHVQQLLQTARDKHTHLIPRAGGTSIAGQVVGPGIVADISRHWNHILEINAKERWVRVEPGVVRDELNLALQPYGLFFSPETSTSNRCCLGGMLGNNSCGTHSLVYGSTRHHALEATAVLTDGTVEVLKEYSITELEARFGSGFYKKGEHASLIERIYAQLIGWALDPATRQLIDDTYPDKELRRRSCGYAIDEVIADITPSAADSTVAEGRINLCRLIAGSEGTLAFVTEMKVSLDPLPPKELMVVCAHCDALEKSFEANLVALEHHPTAIELMDGDVLQLSKGNAEQQKNRFFVEGDPAALLISELRADSREELDRKADALEQHLKESGLVYLCTRVYGADVSRVWALRKAGLGILGGMKGDAKPMGVIEDTAVAPRRLPAYLCEFREMLERLHAHCVFYGHISTGELHLRPIVNLKTREGRKLFRDIATETALLVKKHRGSISGEHGDGRLRGEFIRLQYGEETYELMRQVKQCWDPDGLLNLHKIVDTLPMDSMLRFDEDQPYALERDMGPDGTVMNWRAAFDECRVEGASGVRSQVHALMCSIEQCNGAGDCRKSTLMGGTMCPAYKVSGDETWTTRARANVLRELLTRGWEGKAPAQLEEIAEMLHSCLACKGCRRECPSNVDMTKIRAEVLQWLYDRHGTPRRSWLVARMAQIETLGHWVWPFYNLAARWKPTAVAIKWFVGFAPERAIPTLSRTTLRQEVARVSRSADERRRNRRRVYLLADEFTDHQEPELGQAFASLLTHLGYEVVVPRHVESGRAAISKGCLHRAKKLAAKNVELLSPVIQGDDVLVGIEPSCILTFRDEYPDLVPARLREQAKALGTRALLYDEFIMHEVAAGRITSDMFQAQPMEIWLHGHCHQKALVGVEQTAAMLRLLKGATVHVIPSGCCGMAGSFGYEKEHYQTSLAIGELVLFPAVRRAMKEGRDLPHPTFVAAPGTSCRQQILDGTGVKALHPIEIMRMWLAI